MACLCSKSRLNRIEDVFDSSVVGDKVTNDCKTFGHAPEARELLSTKRGDGCRDSGAGIGLQVSEVQFLDWIV